MASLLHRRCGEAQYGGRRIHARRSAAERAVRWHQCLRRGVAAESAGGALPGQRADDHAAAPPGRRAGAAGLRHRRRRAAGEVAAAAREGASGRLRGPARRRDGPLHPSLRAFARNGDDGGAYAACGAAAERSRERRPDRPAATSGDRFQPRHGRLGRRAKAVGPGRILPDTRRRRQRQPRERQRSGARHAHRPFGRAQRHLELVQRLATSAGLRQAALEYQAARRNHDIVERQVEEATRLAWNELTTARRRVELLDNAVAIASEVFEARQKLREAGRETVINVLDAENEVYNARINLTQASGDVQLAIYRLLQGMGRLGPAELGLETSGGDG